MGNKIILLIFLLLLAYGLAVVLLRRLTETVRQIGELRGEMKKNDALLGAKIDQLQAQQEAQAEKDKN